MSLSDQLDVFHGPITEHSVRVYVRINSLPGGGEWSLGGQIRGPFSRGIRTLPLTASLEDLGPGDTLLGRGLILDPASWDPVSPIHYLVTVEVRRDGEPTERLERRLAIRRLGARGRALRWEGKDWLWRGVCVAEQAIGELAAWREKNAVPVVSRPSDDLLQQASDEGTLLAVEVGVDVTAADLRRLSSYPAVGIAVFASSCEEVDKLKSFAPNILFAQAVDSPKTAAPSWTDILLGDAGEPQRVGQLLQAHAKPVVAVRRLAEYGSFEQAHPECNRLQRDLAVVGGFAGYVV